MGSHFRNRIVLVFAALAAIVAAPVASAIQKSVNLGPNLGQFNYAMTSTQRLRPCGDYFYWQTYYTYSSFAYVSSLGTNQSIPGSTYYWPGVSGCSTTVAGPVVNYAGNGYTFFIVPEDGDVAPTISVPGYINPKYLVVGVIYTPPGHQSSVSYKNSNLLSSTVTTKNSYAKSYSVGNAAQLSGTIKAYKLGSVDLSVKASATYTQTTTTTDSSAVTVQKETGYEDGPYPGPACDYCGVDHDYDIIKVWLNPVQLFTLTNGGVVQPNGYGFSSWDQPGMDVYPVYAGELNGDIPMQPSTVAAFARSWASPANGFSYGPGDSPALTAQDELNILLTDAYWNCTYKSPVSDGFDCAKPADATFSGSVTTNGTSVTWVSGSTFNQLLVQGKIVISGVTYTVASVNSATSLSLASSAGNQTAAAYSAPSRFTQSTNLNFPYRQPAPGGQPVPSSYKWIYTNTNTTGTGYSYESKVEYGLETVFGFKLFGIGFQDTLTQTWSMDHTYETSSEVTSQNQSEADATITEPVCNVVNGACSPVYPPLNAYNPISCSPLAQATAFGQGDNMYLYQDNLFGTFMIEPYGEP